MIDRLRPWFPLTLLIVLAALTFWLDALVQNGTAARDGSGRHDPDFILENFTATRMNEDGARVTCCRQKMTITPTTTRPIWTNPASCTWSRASPACAWPPTGRCCPETVSMFT